MIKSVSFKDKKDKDIVDFIKDKDFSYYVKNLIREDMEKTEFKKDIEYNKKRNVNFDI